MSRRLVLPLTVGAAAFAVVIGLAQWGGSSAQSAQPTATAARTPAAPASPATTVLARPPEAPPAWPATQGPPPSGRYDAELRSGQVTTRGMVEPGPGFAMTVEQLAAKSPYVAIVVAVEQRHYWSSIGATTATNYRVERVVKGKLPAYVQVAEFGAPANSFPHSEQAWMPANDAAPEVGRRYLLFLRTSLGQGRYATRDGANSRFEVVDGTVRSVRERHPRADLAIDIEPAPLDTFLRRVRG